MNERIDDERIFNTKKSFLEKRINWFNRIAWISLILGIIVFIIAIAIFFLPDKFGFKELELNELGDLVGGVIGTLFSLSGLLFIYVSFLSQRLDLLYQLKELKINQDETRLAREEFEKQTKIFDYQTFSARWNTIISGFYVIVESLNLKLTDKDLGPAIERNYTGSDCFRGVNRNIHDLYRRKKNRNRGNHLHPNDSFHIFHEFLKSEFDKEFNHLVLAIKDSLIFLSKSSISQEEKILLGHMLLRSLNSYGIIYLFYRYMPKDESNIEIRNLLLNFDFVDLVSKDLLIHKDHILI